MCKSIKVTQVKVNLVLSREYQEYLLMVYSASTCRLHDQHLSHRKVLFETTVKRNNWASAVSLRGKNRQIRRRSLFPPNPPFFSLSNMSNNDQVKWIQSMTTPYLSCDRQKPILYGYFRSGTSWRTRTILAWKGIEYENRFVDLAQLKNVSQQTQTHVMMLMPWILE